MTPVGNLATAASQHPQTSSQTATTAKTIPVEQRRALGDVFDRWRLNQGWNPWDNTTQDMAIASWAASLDREGVPPSAYGELYERVLQRRASAINAGRDIPKFGVELLIAEWNGEHGLRAELKQREIDRARSLPSNAESVCQLCFGTGFRSEMEGQYRVSRKCDHGNAQDLNF